MAWGEKYVTTFARLTAAVTGGSLATLSSAVDNIERWLDARCPDGVWVQRIVVSVDDLQDVLSTSRLEG